MKRIFTLLVSLCVVSFAMAQAPEGVFAKATSAPVVDGVVDAVWIEATAYNIDKNFQTDLPTVGAAGETTWQGLWTDEGVYILLKVTDNEFYPNYVAGPKLNSWDYDKPELYFDVNYDLVEVSPLGAKSGLGHYQVGPEFTLDKNDGTPNPVPQTDGVIYAFMVTGSNYIAEYFVPYTKLLDNEKLQVDRTNTIGFDVTIIDRDPGDAARNSAVWASNLNGSWDTMDDAGKVTFADAVAPVLVDAVIVTTTNGTITTNKGTLQMLATVTPANATNKGLYWTIVGGTAQVSMTPAGLISAASNGTVSVKASTTDGSYIDTEPVTVTITGQTPVKYSEATWNEKNIIKNWNFSTDMTDWGGWVDLASIPTAVVPASVDGVCQMVVANHADVWRYQHNQSPLSAEADVEYTLKFKSWSTGTSPGVVNFESASNIEVVAGGDKQVRYGVSPDPESNGSSEWNYTATVLPSWFTFHVTFDKIMETTVQKIQWMISKSDQTIFLDSVLLVKTEDIDIISEVSKQLSNSLKVYTQDNSLTVQLSSAVNTKIAIYNSLGQKMMEKVSTGNVVKFNVSNLRKGMYFVKLSDGSIQKFVK